MNNKAQFKKKNGKLNNKAQLKKKEGKLNNKAQLKIQEMIFVILGVFLFFILAALFVLAIINSNITKTANQIASDKTFGVLTSLASSPEFICTDSRTNCIDGDKIIGLINDSNYIGFWPFSSLIIIKESGLSKNEDQLIKCTPDNYPNCDAFMIYDLNKNETTTQTFVALCRKDVDNGNIYDKCEIAKIIAGTEIK